MHNASALSQVQLSHHRCLLAFCLSASVAFPCLTSLTLLGGAYTIWFIVGQVWTFSATVGRTPDTGAECPEQLFHAALFAVIATYVLTAVQLCLTCMRRCCQKDILPV